MRRWALSFSCVALLLLGAASGPPSAPAGTPAQAAWYVTMFSDNDFVGGGVQRVFYPGSTGPIEIEGTPAFLNVRVGQYQMTFAAPVGESLRPGGVYVDAERAAFRSPGHPGIDIWGAGRGCSLLAGHFEVKDIGVGVDGVVNRLWIIYEQRCDFSGPALWGEIRVGLPKPTAPLVAPGVVRWPAIDTFRVGTVVPITVIASSRAVALGSATITGAGATDFSITADECSGATLALGASCRVWLRFVPTAPGTRLASLGIADGTSALHSVDLEAFAYGGRTRFEATSDPGDHVGAGTAWSYTGSTATFALGGNTTQANFSLQGADGASWTGRFIPGPNDVLAAGRTYDGATRWTPFATGPALEVDRNGTVASVCPTITGSFTVAAADFASNGRLRSMGISFVQHCNGGQPALRGTWEYRAGDDMPLPPWLIGHVPPEGPASQLLANGSFELDLRGWAWANARATRVPGGADGGYAARLSLSEDAAFYGLTTSPLPVAETTAGRTYEASAYVRSLTPGRRICLVLREWRAAPGLIRLRRACVTGSGVWQAVGPLRYITHGSGGSFELYVEQSAPQAGDSFDLDAVTLRSADGAGPGTSGAASQASIGAELAEPESEVTGQPQPSSAAEPSTAAPGHPNHILGSGVHLSVL